MIKRIVLAVALIGAMAACSPTATPSPTTAPLQSTPPVSAPASVAIVLLGRTPRIETTPEAPAPGVVFCADQRDAASAALILFRPTPHPSWRGLSRACATPPAGPLNVDFGPRIPTPEPTLVSSRGLSAVMQEVVRALHAHCTRAGVTSAVGCRRGFTAAGDLRARHQRRTPTSSSTSRPAPSRSTRSRSWRRSGSRGRRSAASTSSPASGRSCGPRSRPSRAGRRRRVQRAGPRARRLRAAGDAARHRRLAHRRLLRRRVRPVAGVVQGWPGTRRSPTRSSAGRTTTIGT